MLVPEEHFWNVQKFKVGSFDKRVSDHHHPIFCELSLEFSRINKNPKVILKKLTTERRSKFHKQVINNFDAKLLNEFEFIRDNTRKLQLEDKIRLIYSEFYFKINDCMIQSDCFGVVKPGYSTTCSSLEEWKNLCFEISNNARNSQAFFKAFRKYVRPNNEYMPVDPHERAHFIQQHFSNPLYSEKIHEKIELYEKMSYHLIGPLDYHITQQEIIDVLDKMKGKTATGFDCLPVQLLKDNKFFAAPFLEIMYI